MPEKKERDYVLGTDPEELARLGLQHRIWQPHVLECWQKAGITIGKRVLDVGAGPGFASFDLAGIVGEQGEVVGVERSSNFLAHLNAINEARNLNIRSYELDLMEDEIPEKKFDFTWCRWVNSFVSNPAILVEKLAKVLKPNGRAIFHEYINYASWSLAPASQAHIKFVQEVMASWRAMGGEPDAALVLPKLLQENGFKMVWTKPLIFSIQPSDYFWQWPASFIDINLERLMALGRIDQTFADEVRKDIKAASDNPESVMLTPMMLEIVVEKV